MTGCERRAHRKRCVDCCLAGGARWPGVRCQCVSQHRPEGVHEAVPKLEYSEGGPGRFDEALRMHDKHGQQNVVPFVEPVKLGIVAVVKTAVRPGLEESLRWSGKDWESRHGSVRTSSGGDYRRYKKWREPEGQYCRKREG
mmetsp:Transcript_30088/g.82639  ORF Transcript_30088/g.82639 Transcript_30088/m.82639 type:complete len:141 (+) Transcript_30088:349-771(+)